VADFECILTQTDACLTKQYQALLATEGVTLDFSADGIRRLAEIAWSVNERTENIGARRLYTVMERLLEEVSFSAGKGRFEKWPSMPATWTASSRRTGAERGSVALRSVNRRPQTADRPHRPPVPSALVLPIKSPSGLLRTT
jgi:hypothetical protein